MLNDAQLMARVDHVTIHAYSGDTGPLSAILGQSAYPDRSFWVTEWSAWCQGCDHGQPVRAEWDFASMTTDQLLDHLEHGASAALVYEGYDSYYEHHEAFSYWGQLAYDADAGTYTPRQRFYTNAQVFRYVRPGMVRLGSTSSDGRVRALVFQDPRTGDVTIVGHNANRTDLNLNVALGGLQLPRSPLRLVQTTNMASLVAGPTPGVQDGTVKVTVAGDGFFTLTSVPEKPPL
jgi:O-glycosyl hydrolase